MRSTLISFDVKYYEYNSGKKEEQGLAIGGYELALLAKLVASYLFEINKAILNPTTYHGIYLDYGLVVFNEGLACLVYSKKVIFNQVG